MKHGQIHQIQHQSKNVILTNYKFLENAIKIHQGRWKIEPLKILQNDFGEPKKNCMKQ